LYGNCIAAAARPIVTKIDGLRQDEQAGLTHQVLLPTVRGMRMPAGIKLFAFFLPFLASVSCGLVSDPTVRLMTNRPELAAYIERYNSTQDDYRLEIAYVESPAQSVLSGEQADIVIGEWLAAPQIMERFESTADIVKAGRIDPSLFYAGLLAMGSKDNRPVLIPVSFDIPALVFMGKNGPSSMGFSPFWNRVFLSSSAALFGAKIRAGRGGVPAYDPDGLAKTVDFLRDWLDRVNGGKDRDAAFADKNLVQPYYKLIETEKILFAIAAFTDFFALPEEKRRSLDFRWPSREGVIPVMEDVLFAGVLRLAKNKSGAKSFLEWFFSLQNQKSLLDVAQSLRIGVFGVTNGFSAFKSLNERELPQKYPILLGHIPSENLLLFPEILPDNWLEIRDEVFWTWLMRFAKGEETAPLSSVLDDWQAASKKK
jgi:hypothetical protein